MGVRRALARRRPAAARPLRPRETALAALPVDGGKSPMLDDLESLPRAGHSPGAGDLRRGAVRIISKSRKHFYGTHKGGSINIDREPDGRFYIIVTWTDGGTLYDGWAPESVTTMKQAKAEAIRGAML
jgi:hypothetical protein